MNCGKKSLRPTNETHKNVSNESLWLRHYNQHTMEFGHFINRMLTEKSEKMTEWQSYAIKSTYNHISVTVLALYQISAKI